MPRKKRHRKRRGHYCWSCQRERANERFTGRGHARHVCRDCMKLGKAELAVRQVLLNVERCVTISGFIHHKHRKALERYRKHSNPRIRALAEQYAEIDRDARQQQRNEQAWEDYLEEGGSYYDLWWEMEAEREPSLAEIQTAEPLVPWHDHSEWWGAEFYQEYCQ